MGEKKRSKIDAKVLRVLVLCTLCCAVVCAAVQVWAALAVRSARTAQQPSAQAGESQTSGELQADKQDAETSQEAQAVSGTTSDTQTDAAGAAAESGAGAVVGSGATDSKQGGVYQQNGVWYADLSGVQVLLVNKEYELPQSYGGENAAAQSAFNRMAAAAATEGLSIYVQSGYRSYSTQQRIFNNNVANYGEENANTFSARPGQSEHQTGLAFDILGTSRNTGLEEEFAETLEYAWLVEHCAEYGFILRYGKDMTESTGYIYEPWHYRYIGDAQLAQKIMDSGLSLEQYIEIYAQ